LTNNPDEKFQRIFNLIKKEKAGAVVFINQENQSQNLMNRLTALKGEKSDSRVDMDEKDFGIGAQILHDLGISKLSVMSNATSTTKRVGVTGYGLEIIDYVNY
jgi:3,4-dihydroxy 2-butanone 4-phosphate synthase/GTP cyclohydrolase II